MSYPQNMEKSWGDSRSQAEKRPVETGKIPSNLSALTCSQVIRKLIYNRIAVILDPVRINEQCWSGFRSGQILNMCQFIQDSFEKQMTGAVFVDLTASYDTVNKRIMLQKLFDLTLDQHLTSA